MQPLWIITHIRREVICRGDLSLYILKLILSSSFIMRVQTKTVGDCLCETVHYCILTVCAQVL